MRSKVMLVPVALFLTSCIFLGGCSKEKPLEPAIQTVRAGVVEQIQPDASERYSASVEAFAKVDLAFKSGGIVEGILQVRGADGRIRERDRSADTAAASGDDGNLIGKKNVRVFHAVTAK